MLVLISVLLLGNISSVTTLASYVPRDMNCIYIYTPEQYPQPLAFNMQNKLLPWYFEAPHQTKIRLACPGERNYLKLAEEESPKRVQDLLFYCYMGIWKMVAMDTYKDPRFWTCTQHPRGYFEENGDCSEDTKHFNFFVKRYQQIEMVTEYDMEIAKPYFGNPELDLFLTPTWVVPFDDFPHLDGLQDEHNSFLLYAHVLQHLQIIDEAIRQLSNKSLKKLTVVRMATEDNEMFMKVKLFSPKNLVISVSSVEACLVFVVSNESPLVTEAHEDKHETFCRALGWPDLNDPSKGLVECYTPKEVRSMNRIAAFCNKGKVLLGPLPVPESGP